MVKDLQYIKILSIFYYVVGGLLALCSCVALLYLFMGVMLLNVPAPRGSGSPPTTELGWFFVIGSSAALLIGWTWAFALMIAGWRLGKCRNYFYCMVMGCSALVFVPIGTVLGVFTIIVLIQPNAKRLFETGGQVIDEDDEDEMEDFDDRRRRDSYNIRR